MLRATVGLAVVLQHTPRAVTDSPPSDVIVPPLVAVVDEMAVVALVVRVGTPVKLNVIILFDVGMSITTAL